MQIAKIILLTFLLAFVTSLLFEVKLISENPIRYALVVLMIIIELLTGFFYVKSIINNLQFTTDNSKT